MSILHPDQRQQLVERAVQISTERGGKTQFVGTRRSDFESLGRWVQENLSSTCAAILADARTLVLEGHQVQALLADAGLLVHVHQVDDDDNGRPPISSTRLGKSIAQAIALHGVDLVISVGGGTMTDLGKIAARELSLPHIAVATAASMNGFTSSLAAVLDEGVKMTSPAPAPIAVFASPSTLRAAPASRSASGRGDLHSKPVSSADWRLAHLLNDAPWDLPVVALLDEISELMDGVAAGLRDDIEDAYGQLFAGLCLTGVAMQSATKGSQASGAEHLVSHYLDMIAGCRSFEHEASTHGAQVAVGCMVALEAWDFVLTKLKAGAEFGPIPGYLLDEGQRQAWIEGHFRELSPSIAAMHAKAPTPNRTREARRARIGAEWSSLLTDCASLLRTRESLERELLAAGCATRFSELGVDASRARDAIRYAPWVRARYTVLHMIDELGWYDEFVERALEATR